MEDIKENLPTFKIIVWILSGLVAVELITLFIGVQNKNISHYAAFGILAISFIYLAVFCLKLIRILHSIDKKE